MLSRVAERIYWIGRYLERAENSARLVNVYTSLLLDLPRNMPLQWRVLIRLTGNEQNFAERYQHAEEPYVVKFLLVDEENSGSMLRSLAAARENARTTREILPSEVWEQINDLYLDVRDKMERGITRGGRHAFLRETILGCQQINGLLSGTMSHDSAYNFAKLGRNLERADMTSRILDIGSTRPTTTGIDESQRLAYENLLWMSILRSLSAYQMYRQHVHNRVKSDSVVAFLLQDQYFPRAIMHCLNEAEACIKQLPRHETVLRNNARAQRRVTAADVPALMSEGFHQFIDDVQLEINDTHQRMLETWFQLQPREMSQSQTQS